MEENESLNPSDVGLFGAQTKMAHARDAANLIEQSRSGVDGSWTLVAHRSIHPPTITAGASKRFCKNGWTTDLGARTCQCFGKRRLVAALQMRAPASPGARSLLVATWGSYGAPSPLTPLPTGEGKGAGGTDGDADYSTAAAVLSVNRRVMTASASNLTCVRFDAPDRPPR